VMTESPYSTDDLADRQFGRIRDVEMDMIFTDPSFENDNIIGIADLSYQVACAKTDVFCQDMLSILGHPNQMNF